MTNFWRRSCSAFLITAGLVVIAVVTADRGFGLIALAQNENILLTEGFGGRGKELRGTAPSAAFDPGSCDRPYTDDSPWNTPIVNPVYSPHNQAHIDAIASGGKPLSSDGTQFTFPVYYVDNSTPRKTVKFETWFSDVQSPTVMHNYRFSSSRVPPSGGGYVVAEGDTTVPADQIVSDEKGVPVPDDAAQSAGFDAQLIIINTDTGEQWGFTFFNRDPVTGALTTGSLSHYNINWNGVPPRSSDDPRTTWGEPDDAPFRQIGAAIPPLAGLIRPCEVIRGVDDPNVDDLGHALQFAYDYPARTHNAVCNPDPAKIEPEEYLYPAGQSDGSSCFPDVLEGTRLQIDPNIPDVTIQNVWGCRDACFVVAKTLQKYGMYVIDESGRPKIRPEYEGTAGWTALALKYQVLDQTLNSIPWSAFKVVQSSAIPTPIRVSNIMRGGSDIVATFQATQGKTYRLERKLEIANRAWQLISTLTATSDGQAQINDPGAINPAQTKAFYRVQLLP